MRMCLWAIMMMWRMFIWNLRQRLKLKNKKGNAAYNSDKASGANVVKNKMEMKTFEITVGGKKAIVVLDPHGTAYTGFLKDYPNIVSQSCDMAELIKNLHIGWNAYVRRGDFELNSVE